MLETYHPSTSSANASPTGLRQGYVPAQNSPRLASPPAHPAYMPRAAPMTASSPGDLIPGSPAHLASGLRDGQHFPTVRGSQGASAPSPSLPMPPTASSPHKRRDLSGRDAGSSKAPVSRVAGPERSSSAHAAQCKRQRFAEQPAKMLPRRYELCPIEDMVELVARMLVELITTNDAMKISSRGELTRFHSRTPPGISVRDYLHRLSKHATLTPPLLLAMVYYIDRLCALYQEFTINSLTVHRFLITAAAVAAKGLSDSFWTNATYARVGGVQATELKLLELDFLCRMDWRIVPNPEVLIAYYAGLVERTPGYVLTTD